MSVETSGFPSVTSGGVYTLRPNNKPVRVRDVASRRVPETKAIGPEGDVTLRANICRFSEDIYSALLKDEQGKVHRFTTNYMPVYLSRSEFMRMEPGQRFLGFRIINGERVDVLLTVDSVKCLGQQTYEYALTSDGPIYIGAGKNPVFLPFFVRRS